MGVTTHPFVRVEIDGTPAGPAFNERLVSLTVTDCEGVRTDRLSLVFDDSPPHLEIPAKGARVEVAFGRDRNEAQRHVGRFIVDGTDVSIAPWTLSVQGHSADLRQTMTAQRERYWDNASVATIVRDIARNHALEANLSNAVTDHVYAWIGQQDESDLHFLERLALRHRALFTIKDATILFLDRGSGQASDGATILFLDRGSGQASDGATVETLIIAAEEIVPGTCKMSERDRQRYRKIAAYVQDRAGAERVRIEVDADPEASGTHVLQEPFASKEEAVRAADACAREMTRAAVTMAASVIGRPDLMAGHPVAFQGLRPGVDGRVFIIEKATHRFGKSTGFVTQITGKLRAE